VFGKGKPGATLDCKVEVFADMVFWQVTTERIAQVTADQVKTMPRAIRKF
jgi:hypothetical protein